MYKAVFLDIDNTLLDFDEYVRDSMRSGFEKFGLKPYEPWMFDIFKKENNKLWRKIEQGLIDFPGLQKVRWNIIFSELGIDFDGITFETFFREYLFESAVPIEGAYELLEYLKGKCLLCAASNGPASQQKNRLKNAFMYEYFDHIFVSEEIGETKPDAGFYSGCFDIINKGLREDEKIVPGDCLIIGDSVSADITGGKNFGMSTCLFDRERVHGDVADADYHVYSLREAAQICI